MTFKIVPGKGISKMVVSTHKLCVQQVRCALAEAYR